MKNLKSNIYLKIGIISILVMLLLIPTTMVKEVIKDRTKFRAEAINEVSEKWGKGQTITGPYLSIPYDKYVRNYSKKDSAFVTTKHTEWLNILPEELNVEGKISPEKRYRGIYEVVVYESNLNISGSFTQLNLKQFDINPKDVHFDKTKLNVGISDLKGIEKQVSLNWDDTNVFFNSGTATKDLVSVGINANVSMEDGIKSAHKFNLKMDIKGSQYLYFTPLGKTTNVTLNSNWQTPSFTGNYLPDSRTVSEEGFTANWNVLHLNRKYPQAWLNSNFRVESSTFGTNLLLPVDSYKKSFRVAKYAVLFIVLTFLVFFFVETLNKVFIHPIQYLLVGIALIVFYVLLISFSEHMLYNLAYILASVLTLTLIAGYTSAILKSKQLGLMILGILTLLYSFIFVIIQLEDYALLIGSIGVFIILFFVMYSSRKIDWYNLKLGKEE